MKTSELSATLTLAMRPWGFVTVDPLLVALWYRIFGNHSIEQFSSAIMEVVMTSDAPPTIAAVNRAIIRKCSAGRPEITEGESWAILMKAVRRFGRAAQTEAYIWLNGEDEYVEEAAKLLGWQNICLWQTNDEVANRAHFWKVLNGQRNRDQQHALLGLPKPKRLALETSGAVITHDVSSKPVKKIGTPQAVGELAVRLLNDVSAKSHGRGH